METKTLLDSDMLEGFLDNFRYKYKERYGPRELYLESSDKEGRARFLPFLLTKLHTSNTSLYDSLVFCYSSETTTRIVYILYAMFVLISILGKSPSKRSLQN